MKMLKVLLKVAKFYAIADSVAGLFALADFYVVNKGLTTNHAERKYALGKFTQLYLNSVNHDCRSIAKTFGITIDDLKDIEDYLEILDVNNAKTA